MKLGVQTLYHPPCAVWLSNACLSDVMIASLVDTVTVALAGTIISIDMVNGSVMTALAATVWFATGYVATSF